jgi:hypothetical protein
LRWLWRIRHWLIGLLAASALTLVPRLAHADDQPFLTLYTTDIETQHGREFEETLIWRANHANEAFNEFETRSEFEYGITDWAQGALYLNYDWAQTHAHAPTSAIETDNAIGTSGELIVRALNPYFDPLGLAFYVEPFYSAKRRSIETKLLVQKNFFNDTLRTALNVNFEDRWEKNALGHFDQGSALEFNFGASYNITADFSAGLEFDNERGFAGEILGGDASEESNSFYLGPTIQYVSLPWAVTLGFQTQLPIASNPTHTAGAVVGGMTAGDEHFRTLLRLTRAF